MAVLYQIEAWRWRRKMSSASWLWDRINLHLTLALCTRCQWKMPYRWDRRLHYQEMTMFHGRGVCDGCRYEEDVSLFQSMETEYFAQCERNRQYTHAARAQDRAAQVTDSRRVS